MRPDLNALLAELQNELRLRDWRIEIGYVRDLKTSDGRPANGLCSHLVDAKVARIAIRDPETPATNADPSVEETLIHELLHLHFAPLSGSAPAEIAVEEQAVWAITEALNTAKNTARRGQIARAMVAHTAARTRRSQPQECYQMDPATIAALRALLNTDDVGASLKTFLDSMEGAGASAGADAAAPPMAQDAPPAPVQQPNPDDQPKAQRPALPAPGPTAPKPAPQRPAASAARAAASPAPVVPATVTRDEFERFRVDTLLTHAGQHLTPGQRAFASTLSYEQAKNYLAVDETEQPSVERRRAPTQGAKQQTVVGGTEAALAYIDRRMGVNRERPQAVTIDPVTHRLSISALAPVHIQEASTGAGEGK